MPEPVTIISLLAVGKVALSRKATSIIGDKTKELGINQLTQFRENLKLHLRQIDRSIPKALRLAYLQATLQVCALHSDELGANVTSYPQYLKGKILRRKGRYNEPLGILAQAEVQWLEGMHNWLRAEIAKAKEGKLPPLEITEQHFADLAQFDDESDADSLRQWLTESLIAEVEQACPGMPDRFRSLLIEGWLQYDMYEQTQQQTWFICFCVCFQQALAKDPQARAVFQIKLLASITHKQQQIDFEQFAAPLRKLNEQLAAQDVSDYFDDLLSQLDIGFVALHDHLNHLAEATRNYVEEAKIEILLSQDQVESKLDEIHKEISDQGEKTAGIVADRLKNDISRLSAGLKYPKGLVDDQIQKDLSIMRRSRFFEGFSRSEHSLRLAEKILSGEFEGGSDALKSIALAWCSRVLAFGDTGDKSDEYLSRAKQLGDGPEVTMAEAFRVSARGALEEALSRLADIDSSSARSAAFLIVAYHRDASAAVEWFSTVGFQFSDLDADGKYALIAKMLELGRWDAALEYTNALHEDDFRQAPVLFFTSALANLVQAIPGELRAVVLHQLPFEAIIFPLASDQPSLKYRRKAQDLFQKSALTTRELDCVEVTNLAEDYALWLELRDQKGHDSGREKLEASMRESEHSLRRLHLALQFGLNLDLAAVEQEIERRTALSGGKSSDAALARFALAFVQKSPEDVADYIDRHRAQLQEHVGNKPISVFEIEMLSRAGLLERAEERFVALIEEGLSEGEEKRLRRIITEAKGVDPIEASKAEFERLGEITELINLVRLLEEKRDWPQLCHFGSLLFERTKALPDAERLATALDTAGRYSDLAMLLKKYPEFRDQSDKLQMLWSWSLYREGLLAESDAALKKLLPKHDHPAGRALRVRLSIASGEWEALLPFVEAEWDNREKRDADDLMRTAHLAHLAGSPRAEGLVYQAISKAPDNAGILVAAYSLATKAGWEDTEAVAQWLQKAAELSDERGPIHKKTLKDLLDRAPEWNRREMETWQGVNDGSLPVFCAAHLLNKSLVDMFLFPAIANPSEADPRRRALVPAYSGVRQSSPCGCRVVAMDPTALLTLGTLGLLETSLKLFDRVLVPHYTLAWLFEEKGKVSFHQPSRIKEASSIRELLANNELKAFSRSAKIDADLAAEVGEGLASLIAEASAGENGDERQRVVIRPFPVHRVGSLMDEEADLSAYYSHLCSCSSVVNKLKQKGQLTVTEESRARSYLRLHEKEWPDQPEISDGAVLYLDDISVTYLQHTGLLEKLRPAGLEAYVSEGAIEEGNALLRYDRFASEVDKVIEAVRNLLAAGIQSGIIKLGQLPATEQGEEPKLRDHPTFALFDLAKDVEAILVDDRSLNKHGRFNSGSSQTPIITTLDLLDGLYSNGHVTLDKMLECRTGLRRAGYLFVPVTNEELERHLSAATVVDGRLIEPAELKAIRENILKIRMSRFLQLPTEAPWLLSVMQTFMDTLKAQWHPELDEATARARSEWLLGLLDRRGWAHCLGSGGELGVVEYWHSVQIWLLISLSANMTLDAREKYLRWIDERVLINLSEEDPEVYSYILERTKEIIAQVTMAAASQELE
jgi:hypothetical protein